MENTHNKQKIDDYVQLKMKYDAQADRFLILMLNNKNECIGTFCLTKDETLRIAKIMIDFVGSIDYFKNSGNYPETILKAIV